MVENQNANSILLLITQVFLLLIITFSIFILSTGRISSLVELIVIIELILGIIALIIITWKKQ